MTDIKRITHIKNGHIEGLSTEDAANAYRWNNINFVNDTNDSSPAIINKSKAELLLDVIDTLLPLTDLDLTDNGDHIQLSFEPQDLSLDVEIWRSYYPDIGYELIGYISASELDPVTVFNDSTFEYQTRLYYQLFARDQYKRSDVLSGDISSLGVVGDVSDLVVKATVDGFELKWINPDDRRYLHTIVKVDIHLVEGSLSEANSVEVYRGTDQSFYYPIQDTKEWYYYKFWVYTYTKTL